MIPNAKFRITALHQILEAARWAPTAHNMQNFDIIVIDEKAALAAIGAVRFGPSLTFFKENYLQLSFSEDELLHRKTGLLASMFPESWRRPDAGPEPDEHPHGSMLPCPMLMLVIYDTRRRAPDSEGDVLGIMSLGLVMQNMWLMTEVLGIGMHIASAFSSAPAENEVHRILRIPAHMKIGFACRFGYPETEHFRYLRVRRNIGDFVHHKAYGNSQHV